MTSVVRYAQLANASGAVMTTTTGLVIDGKEHGFKLIRRTLAAIDVGAEAGKTQHVGGCIMLTVKGAKIKEVFCLEAWRPTTDTNVYNQHLYATPTPHVYQYGWRIVDDATAGNSSIYLYDKGDHADTKLAAGDFLTIGFLIGNY